jgi:hypothetical protein
MNHSLVIEYFFNGIAMIAPIFSNRAVLSVISKTVYPDISHYKFSEKELVTYNNNKFIRISVGIAPALIEGGCLASA